MAGTLTARWHSARLPIFSVVAALYVAGLLAWLVLGLLPPLASAIPALRTGLADISGNGPIGGLASRVLEHESSLPHGPEVAVQYLFSVLNLGLGFVLLTRAPATVVPRLLALGFLGTAATFNEPSHAVFHIIGHEPAVTAIHFCFHIVSGVAYVWAVALFPDGRLPLRRAPRRSVVAAVAAVSTGVLVWICYHSSFVSHPPFFVQFFGAVVPVVGIAAQTAHLRDDRLPVRERQQSRLLRFALVPALVLSALWGVARAVAYVGGDIGSNAAGAADNLQSAFPFVFALVPVVLLVAVLRYRLFEVDLVLSRALMFLLLAGSVALVFAATIAAASWLLRGQGIAAAAAMVVVGLAIEPVRRWCAAAANRLVFGQTHTPRESMRLLAARLAAPTDDDALAELVTVVVTGTRCTRAELWLVDDDTLHRVAAAPPAGDDGVRALPGGPREREAAALAAFPGRDVLAVRHDARLLGVLVTDVPAGTALPPAERRLLDDLARSAGLLIANARLVHDLAERVASVGQLAADLWRSRQRVVAAQDAERRRLERDLHDGAQQDLVALLLQLRVAERAGAAPDRIDALRSAVDIARAMLRDVSEGSTTAGLADGGVVAALLARFRSLEATGVAVDVRASVDGLPPDIAEAVYFCCLEAVQNAVKHAHASRLEIGLDRDGGDVVFTVRDDGVGFDPGLAATGRGLHTYDERLAVLGGDAVIESAPGLGTLVRGRVPCAAPAEVSA